MAESYTSSKVKNEFTLTKTDVDMEVNKEI